LLEVRQIDCSFSVKRTIYVRNNALCSQKTGEGSSGDNQDKRTSQEKLEHVFLHLSEAMPKTFVNIDYTVYSLDMQFEDNIRNIKTVGLEAYIKNMSLLRIMAYVKYSFAGMTVLKITQHPEDNTVRVRWRVVGTPGMFSIGFWKNAFWNPKKFREKGTAEWTDGFSVFYVNNEGLINRHVVEKMMPDDDTKLAPKATGMAVKLGLLFGAFLPHGQKSDEGQSTILEDIMSLLV
jgi:hypothetical protein